jgi:polysaccharide pyruvyl transferase WcaK-like protein
MKKITVFNTFISSANMGDAIIMDYSMQQLQSVFPEAYFFHAPTHDYARRASYKFIRNTTEQIVCGTNLLHDKMYIYNQWKINLIDAAMLRNVSLMGVGTSSYYGKLDWYSRWLYKSVLSNSRIQSVRDSYTKEVMHKAGFKNVLNTGCPTTWKLTPEFCQTISTQKAQSVITTLTDYDGYATTDKEVIDLLSKNYEKVYLWIQGFYDVELAEKLGITDKVTFIAPHLEAFDKILGNEDVEYIGTRLHAGIRALNFKRRTCILAVDNRAIEMGKSFNLNVVARGEAPDFLKHYITSQTAMEVKIPLNKIEKWKNQFKDASAR